MRIGDVVWLNSGGPPLTVVSIHFDGLVTVHWLGVDTTESLTVPSECLTQNEPHD